MNQKDWVFAGNKPQTRYRSFKRFPWQDTKLRIACNVIMQFIESCVYMCVCNSKNNSYLLFAVDSSAFPNKLWQLIRNPQPFHYSANIALLEQDSYPPDTFPRSTLIVVSFHRWPVKFNKKGSQTCFHLKNLGGRAGNVGGNIDQANCHWSLARYYSGMGKQGLKYDARGILLSFNFK